MRACMKACACRKIVSVSKVNTNGARFLRRGENEWWPRPRGNALCVFGHKIINVFFPLNKHWTFCLHYIIINDDDGGFRELHMYTYIIVIVTRWYEKKVITVWKNPRHFTQIGNSFFMVSLKNEYFFELVFFKTNILTISINTFKYLYETAVTPYKFEIDSIEKIFIFQTTILLISDLFTIYNNLDMWCKWRCYKTIIITCNNASVIILTK